MCPDFDLAKTMKSCVPYGGYLLERQLTADHIGQVKTNLTSKEVLHAIEAHCHREFFLRGMSTAIVALRGGPLFPTTISVNAPM